VTDTRSKGDAFVLTKWLNIVDLLKQLVEARSKTDRQYVEDFLDPLWHAFIRVHEDYKDSFAKYRLIISPVGLADNKSADDLLTQMQEDSVGSQDIRSDLQSILKHLPSPGKGARNHSIHRFGQAILDYFQTDTVYRHHTGFLLLNLRLELIVKMESSAKGYPGGEKPQVINYNFEEAERILESATEHIQGSYAAVADAYHGLRANLLKAK
jgi:hypothetical protein